ncbi:MAG: tRNA preQ1(34) S-adenosylmethionine ribosyltransferase-isomerase QueA [Pseudomonadota bacterium]
MATYTIGQKDSQPTEWEDFTSLLERSKAMDISSINIPEELIAQHPQTQRDKCRLLCLNKTDGKIKHAIFDSVHELFSVGDVLVFNDSKVVKARFDAVKESGGKSELFLLDPCSQKNAWHSLIKGKNIKQGTKIIIGKAGVAVEVVAKNNDGTFMVSFPTGTDVNTLMNEFGTIPLPPYIKRPADKKDEEMYQTVFAARPGSVASPTAALHFTEPLIQKIKDKGVEIKFVTLHVSYGTFSMVRDIDTHIMHEEFYSVPNDTADALKKCRNSGGKIWAVGTTVVRTMESAFDEDLKLVKPLGATSLFIKPGYKFKAVDSMLTNFHHPSTSLIYLVAAFAGVGHIVSAYKDAVALRYRMLSYGDAMAIVV